MSRERHPPWMWAICIALAIIPVVQHALIRFAPPEGAVPTGLHIADSALFLYSMDMIDRGFVSHYATCLAEWGPADWRYFSVPHLWLYGVLGLFEAYAPLDRFMFYGVANAFGLLLLLVMVYRFMRAAAPEYADVAFVLFSLSGGLGGLLYVLSAAAGLHAHPAFDTYFFRFALYDLIEGPHPHPILYAPRLYYTLSMALCLGGATSVLSAAQSDGKFDPRWIVLVATGTFINARFGMFTLAVVALFLALQQRIPPVRRIELLAAQAMPTLAGFLAAFVLFRSNPAVVENHWRVGDMAAWFSPLVCAAGLHALVALPVVWRAARRETLWLRAIHFGLLAYLAAYAVLYLGHQRYYGNLLAGNDGSVAAAISDWALVGGLLGSAFAWVAAPIAKPRSSYTWIVLWLLIFAAVSLSGFGGGWFLRFGPQRLLVFLWIPLCLVTAMGLVRLRPPWRRLVLAMFIALGALSIVVSAFFVQGPLARVDGQGPLADLHPEVMRIGDRELIDRLPGGMVLAPAPMSDIIVLQRGNPVVFGIGTFNLTDRSYVALKGDMNRFFDPRTPEPFRRAIVERWCVDVVVCPVTWPVPEEVFADLHAYPWLRPVAREGPGAVFQVLR